MFQENINAITNEYYRLFDLIEAEREYYSAEESVDDEGDDDNGAGDGDYDILPVKAGGEKAREEL